jgi:protein phosphatase
MQSYSEPILDAQQRAFLRALPRTAARTIGGCRFFPCYATPMEPLFRYCPAEPVRWAAEVESLQADLVLTGHTHLPFTMDLGKQQIVNPGSVGQLKHGAPVACCALWEDGRVSLESRPYPVEETVGKIFTLPVSTEVCCRLAEVLRPGSPRRLRSCRKTTSPPGRRRPIDTRRRPLCWTDPCRSR